MSDRIAIPNAGRLLALDLLLWSLVALAFALQGYGVSAYRGTPQPWWPSFGYSLAIFSVWAILSPAVVIAVKRAERRLARGWRLAIVCAAGLPLAAALHVAIFAVVYWPIYNGAGAISSRSAMAERMALANLDTNGLFYAIVVGATLVWTARRRRFHSDPAQAASPDAVPAQPVRLHIRGKGRIQIISADEIDWIGAAGDYAEVHAGAAVHLIEKSLAALERELPAADFARIHRSALVRLDRVAEISSLGRGDARLLLADGTELRMSRRYRANLACLLNSPSHPSPARRDDGSRPPIRSGWPTSVITSRLHAASRAESNRGGSAL